MILNLLENINVEKTKVTIEYKEKDEQVSKLIDFVEHLEEMENCFTASAGGKVYSISTNDILYIESVDRKTFGYTVNEVYELGFKLYEIEERYKFIKGRKYLLPIAWVARGFVNLKEIPQKLKYVKKVSNADMSSVCEYDEFISNIGL